MANETSNHGYKVPVEGEQNWDELLNQNIRSYEIEIEIRDTAANRSNYKPTDGAKFLATDTGVVYLGDGSDWTPMFLVLDYDGSTRQATISGTLVASELDVGTITGGVTGSTELTSIAGNNLSIDSNGQLNASTGGGGGDWTGTNDVLSPSDSSIVGIDVDELNAEKLAASGPFKLTINGSQTLRLGVPKSDGNSEASGNIVAGHPNNTVNNGAVGVVIGGGGGAKFDKENTVGGNYATVAGGGANTASERNATVAGGFSNTASATEATVSGGSANEASGESAAVMGGLGNVASAPNSTVGGGNENTASAAGATVPGGFKNTASGSNATVVGGFGAAEAPNSFVWNDSTDYHDIPNENIDGLTSETAVDGEPVTGSNTFTASASNGVRFITGGSLSPKVTYIDDSGRLSVGGATVQSAPGDPLTFETSGGRQTLRLGVPLGDGGKTAGGNVVAGHPDNKANNGAVGVVVGGGGAQSGNENTAGDNYATVSGGVNNTSSGEYATVGGGQENTGNDFLSTVAGGGSNTASGNSATVAGGYNNTASGFDSTVAGGRKNEAAAKSSFAAGREAKARANGALVWGDSSSDVVESTTENEVVFQAGGGVTLWSSSDFSSGVQLGSGSGSWSSLSARSAKRSINPVDPEDVLAGVEQLDISRWAYETDPETNHMGPMAGPFHETFGVGQDERHITGVDGDGVALAAIQGLSRRLDNVQEGNDERADRLDELEAMIEKKDERIDALVAANDQLREATERVREENEQLRDRLAAIEAELDLGG